MYSYLFHLSYQFTCKIIKKSNQIIVLFFNDHHLFSYVFPGFLFNIFSYFLKTTNSFFLYLFSFKKRYLQKIIMCFHKLIYSTFYGGCLIGELRGRNFKVLYSATQRSLVFIVGLSHFIICKLPPYITLHSLDLKRNTFVLFSLNQKFLTTFFSFFNQLRKVDRYKGKGIFLYNKFFPLKVGKKTDY